MSTSKRPLVVIVDDEDSYRDSAKELIRVYGERKVKTAGDLHRLRDILATCDSPTIFLVDYKMPWAKGTDVIRKIREHIQCPSVCALMTAETNVRVKMEANAVGASLFNKVSLEQESVAKYLLSVIGYMENQLEKEIQLERSKMDKLTGEYGAYNWDGGQETCAEILAESKRLEMSVALIFLDANNFKGINDRFSHDKGDLVIKVMVKEAARDIRLKPRPGHPKIHDVVFRRSEEVAVLLAEIPDDVSPIEPLAEAVAHRIQSRLHQQTVDMGSGMHVVPYVSYGLSVLSHRDMEDPVRDVARLLREADISMYHGKLREYQKLAAQGVEGAQDKVLYYAEKLAERQQQSV